MNNIFDKQIRPGKWIIVLALSFIIFLTLYIYSFSFKGGFIWDDYPLIYNNVSIRSFSHLKEVFTSTWGAGSGVESTFYRPFTIATFMIDYKLWGLHANGYHLGNTLMHIAAALLVFWIVRILAGGLWQAFAAALLFAVFPGNVETVACISARTEIFSTVFSLSALGFYILFYEKERPAYFIFSSFFVLLGFLTKESILVFFAIALCYHFCFTRKIRIVSSLILLGLVVLYFCLRRVIFSHQLLPFAVIPHGNILGRLMLFSGAFFGYLKIIFWPFGLHVEYMDYPFSWYDPRVIAGLIIFTALIAVILLVRKKYKVIAFGLSWFVVGLSPYSGIYPLPFYKADHYLYFPAIGLFLVLGIIFGIFYQKQNRLAALVLIAATLFYSLLAVKQNSYWIDAVQFYKRTLHYSPYSKRIRVMLGREYLNRDQLDLSVATFKDLIKFYPGSFVGYYELGFDYATAGQKEAAIAQLNKAMQFHDGEFASYLNTGDVFLMWGYCPQARQAFHEALRLKPGNATAQLKLLSVEHSNCFK